MKEFNNYEQTMKLIKRVENGERLLIAINDYFDDLIRNKKLDQYQR